jgi:hypothetical protein
VWGDLDAMSVFLRLHPLAGTALTLVVIDAIRQSEYGSTIKVGGHAGNGELILSASGEVALDSDGENAGETYCKFQILPIPGARKVKGLVEIAPGKFKLVSSKADTRHGTSDVLKAMAERVAALCAERGALIAARGNGATARRGLEKDLKPLAFSTYAIARDCFDWSGDYLSAWLRQHGLPSAHSLIRQHRVAVAIRLLGEGHDESDVAMQIGVSSRSYLKRLLAEDGARRAA